MMISRIQLPIRANDDQRDDLRAHFDGFAVWAYVLPRSVLIYTEDRDLAYAVIGEVYGVGG